jgi:hypothetical protein
VEVQAEALVVVLVDRRQLIQMPKMEFSTHRGITTHIPMDAQHATA